VLTSGAAKSLAYLEQEKNNACVYMCGASYMTPPKT